MHRSTRQEKAIILSGGVIGAYNWDGEHSGRCQSLNPDSSHRLLSSYETVKHQLSEHQRRRRGDGCDLGRVELKALQGDSGCETLISRLGVRHKPPANYNRLQTT